MVYKKTDISFTVSIKLILRKLIRILDNKNRSS